MPRQVIWCIQLALVFHYMCTVDGYADIMFKQPIAYTIDDISENVPASSMLQCARRCSFYPECAAVDFQEDNSTCVILISATKTAEMTNKKQYMKMSCEEGWRRFANSCYYVTPSKHNRNYCKDVCTGYGGHLVSDTSKEESLFIVSVKQGVGIWIGGMKISLHSGDGMWDTGETWDYTNWSQGQPNNKFDSEYCIHYYDDQPWGDMACNMLHHCMCEKKLL